MLDDTKQPMTKAEAASLGGQAVVRKYGKDYMRRIGRNGAAKFWEKYRLEPVLLTKFAIVDRITGKVVAIKES